MQFRDKARFPTSMSAQHAELVTNSGGTLKISYNFVSRKATLKEDLYPEDSLRREVLYSLNFSQLISPSTAHTAPLVLSG